LARLESSVAGIDSRVTRAEGSRKEVEAIVIDLDQSLSTPTPGVLLPDGGDGDVVEHLDPTDGMGSITFAREEDFGYFGKLIVRDSRRQLTER
tara:strand:+ start:12065 stop:12343 length:279 start_codon:yes stop_codon:yes gene_type:complete